jgi:heme exporter protein C
MKALIIAAGVLIGIIFGLFPGINKPKPLTWKILAFSLMLLLILVTFIPPIGANFATAKYLANAYDDYTGNLLLNVSDDINYNNNDGIWEIGITQDNKKEILVVKSENLPTEIKDGNILVIKFRYDKNKNVFVYQSTVSVNPLLTFPLVPGLEEQIRIMNFHVPVAWISVLAYFFAMFYAIQYLRTRKPDYDLKASAAAEIGIMFTILATVTGMIWAKLNWGSFWNWDPRETAIFLLLLIYGAYFALRAAIENEDLRAKLSSVYSIIAFITVPFLVFALPRILEGLHPGSENDSTAGPILSTQQNTLNYLQQVAFSMGFAAFSMLFFWLLNLKYRLKKIEYKIL